MKQQNNWSSKYILRKNGLFIQNNVYKKNISDKREKNHEVSCIKLVKIISLLAHLQVLPRILDMKQQVDKGNKYKASANSNVGNPEKIIMASQPT